MSKGKFQKKGSKILVLMLAMMLVFGMAVGGTLAYLMDTSEEVTNTFTVGDINIELWEHDLENGALNTAVTVAANNTDYKVLPGTKQAKDPYVVVKANSEACWLFVKITQKNNANPQLVSFTVASGWTELTAGSGIYWREQAATTADTDPIYILSDNEVSYSADLTKAQLKNAEQPKLIFQAYAVQKEAGADAAAAWTVLNAG